MARNFWIGPAAATQLDAGGQILTIVTFAAAFFIFVPSAAIALPLVLVIDVPHCLGAELPESVRVKKIQVVPSTDIL